MKLITIPILFLLANFKSAVPINRRIIVPSVSIICFTQRKENVTKYLELNVITPEKSNSKTILLYRQVIWSQEFPRVTHNHSLCLLYLSLTPYSNVIITELWRTIKTTISFFLTFSQHSLNCSAYNQTKLQQLGLVGFFSPLAPIIKVNNRDYIWGAAMVKFSAINSI